MNTLVHHLNLVKPSSPFDQAPRIEILCGAVNPSASRRVKGDERLLGSSDFVERVLELAEEGMEKEAKYQARGLDIESLLRRTVAY